MNFQGYSGHAHLPIQRLLTILTAAALAVLTSVATASAQDAKHGNHGHGRECDDYNRHRSPYFGDLHVHTSFSMDSFLGNPDSDPNAAYRFAQGEPIGFPPVDSAGNPAFTVQLDRPLDFAAVTDHAEFFGEVRICETPSHPGYNSPECETLRGTNVGAMFATWFFPLNTANPEPRRFEFCDQGDQDCLDVANSVWEETRAAAIAADDPTSACEFTSFIGYEWTANTAGANLHRNVIFGNEQVPELPVSFLDAPRVNQLHDAIEDGCIDAGIGCDAVIIPHNSNLSLGRMFLTENFDGDPFDEEEARRRARLEPLVEIIQHKGASECHPAFSTNDERCGFETLPFASIFPPPPGTEPPAIEPPSFARNGLLKGLELRTSLGENPFEFGFVGGSDDHNAAAGAVEEGNYPGHLTVADSSLPGRLSQIFANPGGLTVIWAEENTRESLFRALKRREVYATSGTRPVVRFFGGFRYRDSMCNSPSFAARGYAKGVPMGGELHARGRHPNQNDRMPTFAVSGLRDPGVGGQPGAPLERIQIVKGWVDDTGQAQEEVIDVAVAEEGGADSLCTVWTDPRFNADEPAFYYARVLEVPTPRWQTRQCQAAQVDCSLPDTVPPGLAACCSPFFPKDIQERAWTSPIWFHPED